MSGAAERKEKKMKESTMKKTGLLGALALAVLLAVSVFALTGCGEEKVDTTDVKVPAMSLLNADQAYPIITSTNCATDDFAALQTKMFKDNASVKDDAKAVMDELGATDVTIDDETGIVTAKVETEKWTDFVKGQYDQTITGLGMGYVQVINQGAGASNFTQGTNQVGVQANEQITDVTLTVNEEEYNAMGDAAGNDIFWQANAWVQDYAALAMNDEPTDLMLNIRFSDEDEYPMYDATTQEMVAMLQSQTADQPADSTSGEAAQETAGDGDASTDDATSEGDEGIDENNNQAVSGEDGGEE